MRHNNNLGEELEFHASWTSYSTQSARSIERALAPRPDLGDDLHVTNHPIALFGTVCPPLGPPSGDLVQARLQRWKFGLGENP